MTTTTAPTSAAVTARSRSFFHDMSAVATRAIKLVLRDVESVIPALFIPVFFFLVNTGSLEGLTESTPGVGGENFDYAAFQLPVAIIFAVTGISRASNLVIDVQDGYFDRLLLTPMNRMALLLGLMVADFLLVVALSLPVMLLGFVSGVTFEAGILGAVVFVLIGALWGLAFTGFPYAIALKTGSPAAVNSSFLLFFPFAFLTTSFVPREQLSGWLDTLAGFNPVTYLLEAERSLLFVGWDTTALGQGLAAVAAVGLLSQSLAFAALRGRVARG